MKPFVFLGWGPELQDPAPDGRLLRLVAGPMIWRWIVDLWLDILAGRGPFDDDGEVW